MQNDSVAESQPDLHTAYTPGTPALRRAHRAELKAQGITKSGNTKRKVRAARNAADKTRLAESNARVQELAARIVELEAGARASPLTGTPEERPAGAAITKTLAWPKAASAAPASPSVSVTRPREPLQAPDPLDDYVAPTRAVIVSPEPEYHWSDQDVSPFTQEDFDGMTPPGSPPS